MEEILTFSRKAFNKGVDDTLSLRLIFSGMANLTQTLKHAHKRSGKNSVKCSKAVKTDDKREI